MGRGGKELNLLPPPQELFANTNFRCSCSGCVHGVVVIPCEDPILSCCGNKVLWLIFAQERQKYIYIMLRLPWSSEKSLFCGKKSLLEVVGHWFSPKLWNEKFVLGCAHAEPCRCSKREILFSFLLGWVFSSGFISKNKSLRILEFKNIAWEKWSFIISKCILLQSWKLICWS